MRFRHHKYSWTKPFGNVRHSWEFTSSKGAVSFHASEYKDDMTCGLEFHSATPIGDRAPDHINCPLIGGRCWHDGTSLYASESVWPIIKPMLRCGEHSEIFSVLEHEHDRYFQVREDQP